MSTLERSNYQGESLDDYLNAMFGYYESDGKASVATRTSTVDKGVDNAVGGSSPTAMGKSYRSTFETILAKFGLDLSDASFDEIIKGDYYSVLKRHGLVDMTASNNAEYQSFGGIV